MARGRSTLVNKSLRKIEIVLIHNFRFREILLGGNQDRVKRSETLPQWRYPVHARYLTLWLQHFLAFDFEGNELQYSPK